MLERNTNSEEKRVAKRKSYYAKNREEILRKKSERRQNNKEVFCQRDAAYYAKNKEEICQRRAIRFQNNKDSKKFFCEACGKSFSQKCNLNNHFNSLNTKARKACKKLIAFPNFFDFWKKKSF